MNRNTVESEILFNSFLQNGYMKKITRFGKRKPTLFDRPKSGMFNFLISAHDLHNENLNVRVYI